MPSSFASLRLDVPRLPDDKINNEPRHVELCHVGDNRATRVFRVCAPYILNPTPPMHSRFVSCVSRQSVLRIPISWKPKAPSNQAGRQASRRHTSQTENQEDEKFRRELPGYASRLDFSRDYVNEIKDEEEHAPARQATRPKPPLMRTLIRFAATSPYSRLNFLIVTVSRRNFYIVAADVYAKLLPP